jgi:aminoglycoside phosphotransferase (APT) family kinase protein
MHAGQLDIDDALVQWLVASQFPQWAGRPLRRIASAGTVNAMYRLGDELVIRLPMMPAWAGDVEVELEWLPRLADRLPLPIPVPAGRGEPTDKYPLTWSVLEWLDGSPASPDGLADPVGTARELAAFVRALRGIELDGQGAAGRGAKPSAEGENTVPPGRISPLASSDEGARESIAAAERLGLLDGAATLEAWDLVLRAPDWDGPPVLMHTDLLPGNLLTVDGRLSAVIDFGGLGVGDPAADTIAAWALLSGPARQTFRDELGVDDATWMRGRGFALRKGVFALPYYIDTNPAFAAVASHIIEQVLADLEST